MKNRIIYTILPVLIALQFTAKAQNYEPESIVNFTPADQTAASDNHFRMGWHWGWINTMTDALRMNQSHCKYYINIGINNAISGY